MDWFKSVLMLIKTKLGFKPRLVGKWTVKQEQPLQPLYGIDLENEIIDDLTRQINEDSF